MSDPTPLEAAIARRLPNPPELATAVYKVAVEALEECRADFRKVLSEHYAPGTAKQYGAEYFSEYLVGRFPRYCHVDLDGPNGLPDGEDIHA
jgi:hypothetical protein